MSSAEPPAPAAPPDTRAERAGLVARLLAPLHRAQRSLHAHLIGGAPADDPGADIPADAADRPGLLSRITTPLSTLTVRLKLSRSRRRTGEQGSENAPGQRPPPGPHDRVLAEAPRRAARPAETAGTTDPPPRPRRRWRVLLAAAGLATLFAVTALAIHLHYRGAIGERDQALAAAREKVDAKDQQLGFMAEELRQKEDRLRSLRGGAAVPGSPIAPAPLPTAVAAPAQAAATVPALPANAAAATPVARTADASAAPAAADPGMAAAAGGDCELKGPKIGDKLRECIAAFNRASR